MKLRLQGPGGGGHELTLSLASRNIGRAEANDIRLPQRTVSRYHCQVYLDEEGYVWVQDLGSRYGTFINGNRLHDNGLLKPGDILRIGQWTGQVITPDADDETMERVELVEGNRHTRITTVVRKKRRRQQRTMVALVLLTLAFISLLVYFMNTD